MTSDNPTYLTDEQAKQLKDFAKQGDEDLKNLRRAQGFGPLGSREIVLEIAKWLPLPDAVNLSIINEAYTSLLENLHVGISIDEIADPKNKKLEFLKNRPQATCGIKLETGKFLSNADSAVLYMIKFLEDSDEALLSKIVDVKIDFDLVYDPHTEELIKLISTKCPNLRSFSCKTIKADVTFLMPNLKSFSCEALGGDMTFIMPHLEFFYCKEIREGSIVTVKSENDEVMQNLNVFNINKFDSNVTLRILPKINNSAEFIFQKVNYNAKIELPNVPAEQIFTKDIRLNSTDIIYGKNVAASRASSIDLYLWNESESKLPDDQNIQMMIYFLENPENADLLTKVYLLAIFMNLDGKDPNVQKFLDLLALKCPHLALLYSSQDIKDCDLRISSLKYIECKSISGNVNLIGMKNLEDFYGILLPEANLLADGDLNPSANFVGGRSGWAHLFISNYRRS